MLPGDRRVPSLVEQASVLQHPIEVGLRRLRPDRRAPQVKVAAEALVAAGRDAPSGLPDAVREIRFVPFRGTEGLVERADALETRAAHDPRADHDVYFLQ